MSKRPAPEGAQEPPSQRRREKAGDSFDIDDIFADAEGDVDEEVRGKGGRRKVLTMGDSLTEFGGHQERTNYELFMDTHLPEMAKAREGIARAASNPLSLEWSKREETQAEVPVEREPPWRLYDSKARNPLLFFKTDWCRNLIGDTTVYKDFEREMRMTTLAWTQSSGARSSFPLAIGGSAGLIVEWLEKHRRIDLWRATYLRVTSEGSALGRLEDMRWLGRAFAAATKVEPALMGLATFDFNLNDAGDYVLRLCYAFGAYDTVQERRLATTPAVAKGSDFNRAFSADNNTIGLFTEGHTRLVVDRREFYKLWRGITREYADPDDEREDGTTASVVRTVHGPTKLPLTFVGYYYFLVNPQQQSTLRPTIVSTLNPLDTLRRERMTINYSMLSVDDPYA